MSRRNEPKFGFKNLCCWIVVLVKWLYKDMPPVLPRTGTTLTTTARTKSLPFSSRPAVSTWPSWRTTGEQHFISHVATTPSFWRGAASSVLLCAQSSSYLGARQERDGDANKGGQGIQRPVLRLPPTRGRCCHRVQFTQCFNTGTGREALNSHMIFCYIFLLLFFQRFTEFNWWEICCEINWQRRDKTSYNLTLN